MLSSEVDGVEQSSAEDRGYLLHMGTSLYCSSDGLLDATGLHVRMQKGVEVAASMTLNS